MEARIQILPSGPAAEHAALQRVADLLLAVNVRWINDQLAAGHNPPVSAKAGDVAYVPWHGDPIGVSRFYLDGASMLAIRRGTCIDVAAYDAASMALGRWGWGGIGAHPVVIVLGGGRYHCNIGRQGAAPIDTSRSLRRWVG